MLNFLKLKKKSNNLGKENALINPKVGCMVCGPEKLVDDVSDLCFKYDMDYHTETFAL